MIWTRLVYGTAIAVALAGTAIYYGGEERATIEAIDIIELTEATRERLMPFSYRLVTNTLTYKQLKWRVDTSDTNRWMHGTNAMPFLAFDGYEAASNTVVNPEGLGQSGTYSAGPADYEYEDYLEFLWGLVIFGGNDGRMYDYDDWVVSLKQSGLTKVIDYYGATNTEPAYVYEVQPAHAVGTANEKATLDWIDSNLLAVIPQYADHEQAVNGVFTNYYVIPMLTVSSVWERLGLTYIWTNTVSTNCYVSTNWVDAWTNEAGNVTNATRIGTNLTWGIVTNITTNYTFTTGPLCTTNMLTERYKVASYLKWTVMPAPAWTNVIEYYGTNLVWPATNWLEDAQDGPIWYQWNISAPGLTEPNYPSWWNYSMSNGPPNAWYAPSQTPLIDDAVTLTATKTNGFAASYPIKTFSTSGSYSKFQGAGWNWWIYPWYQYFIYNFHHGENISGINTLTVRKPCPAVKMPYNIGGVTVIGDVYVSMYYYPWYGMTNVISTNVLTADMTAPSSNSFWWIGDPMEVTEDLFAATNYPMGGGYVGPWPYFWGWDQADNGPYVFSSASWGTSWSSSISKYYQGQRVILKWTFSRCRP